MRLFSRWPIVQTLFMVLLLVGCTQTETRTTTQLLMGTLVTIKTWNVPEAQEQVAVQQAFQEIARIEALMTVMKPEAVAAQINQAPRGTWHPVPDELGQLIRRALAFQKSSNGAFDPGLGVMTLLWGFSADPPASAPPSAAAIQEWLSQRRHGSMIELQEGPTGMQIRLGNPAIALDLGAIAKGYAVDRAIEKLRGAGVVNAIVNAGGNLRVIGSKGAQPWRIGVQHPRAHEAAIASTNLQGDRAMVTSGDYERFFLYNGVRYHHILDPAIGQPAQSGLISVTVQAPTTEAADALSTAAFVLGLDQGLALLEQTPAVEGLLITEDGRHAQTSGFSGEWIQGPWPKPGKDK